MCNHIPVDNLNGGISAIAYLYNLNTMFGFNVAESVMCIMIRLLFCIVL